MSLPVDVDALQDRLAEYGRTAFLITVGEDGGAHVASVVLEVDGAHLRTSVGRTSRANLVRSPVLTLLWPPAADPTYSMIVDAELVATDDDGAITVAPASGVLHRVAGTGDGPTCRPLGDDGP